MHLVEAGAPLGELGGVAREREGRGEVELLGREHGLKGGPELAPHPRVEARDGGGVVPGQDEPAGERLRESERGAPGRVREGSQGRRDKVGRQKGRAQL